jgi:hypothetical protein
MSKIFACSNRLGWWDIFVSSNEGTIWHKALHGTPEPWKSIPFPKGTLNEVDRPTLEAVATSSNQIELVIRTAGTCHMRARYEDGQWSAWTPYGSDGNTARRGGVETQPDPSGSTKRLVHTVGLPVFSVSPEYTLLYRAADDSGWTDLGGYISGGEDHLAAVAQGDGGSDVFALWAERVLMHRRLSARTWSEWEIIDFVPGATDMYSALRPRDLVSLTVRGTGLREQTGVNGVREWIAADGGGSLIVDLPPQHIAETVLAASSSTSHARLSGPSSLHFVVPRGRTVTLSVEGVLAAMNELDLKVAPREQGKASTLELPWRMLLAIQDQARCRHRRAVVSSSDGVTQMWHTRILAPIRAPSPSGYAAVFPFASAQAEIPFANNTPLENQMNRIAQLGKANPTLPMEVDKFILSTCGAWFSGSVSYPNNQLEWTQRTAMGRDFYVRLLLSGVLFPFGHRASVVGVSERKFDTATKAAGLQRTFALIITEPVREYANIDTPHEREFPFQRTEIEPVQVIPLGDRPPPPNNRAYWLKHPDGSAVIFTILAWAGRDAIPMQLPLLFSDGEDVDELNRMYAQGPRAGVDAVGAHPTAVVNQFIPLVMKKVGDKFEPVEGTIQQVQSVTIAANKVANRDGFHPRLAQLEVTLPALKQVLGQDMTTIVATLAPEIRNPPLGRPPDILLEFAKRTLNLRSLKAGAVAAPNMQVNRLHRTMGPAAANLPELFDRSAKLLGVVPLAEIFGAVTDSSRPTITWSKEPPTATVNWVASPTKGHGPFKPVTGACKITLRVTTKSENDQLKTLTDGTITNFEIGIPTPAEGKFLVKLHFSTLTFHAETGELAKTSFNITKAALGKELRLVQQLSSYLPNVGNSAPTVETNALQVRVRYAIAIPTPLSMGLITLQNLLLQAGITLSLREDPVIIDFAFGTRAHPFLVTVMGFGGGGYLELGVRAGGDNDGLDRFVGGIEFGASVAMNFGVAEGEVHVFGGIVFTKQGSAVEIAGYLRVGGRVRILGLISVSIELTVSLTYVTPNRLRGAAKLVIAIDLTFWSTSVEIAAEYTIDGSPAVSADRDLPVFDTTVEHSILNALGPDETSFPWQKYCQAFA